MTKVGLAAMVGCSITAGWFLHQAAAPEAKAAHRTAEVFHWPNQPATSKPKKLLPDAVKATLQKLQANTGSQATIVAEVKVEDRIGLLEAIALESGPGGLDGNLQEAMRAILKVWTSDDFEAAFAWASNLNNPGFRKYATAIVIDQLAETDSWQRAIDLYFECLKEDPSFHSRAVDTALHTQAGISAEALLGALERMPTGLGSHGTEMTFANDFDFKLALDGIAALEQKSGKYHLYAKPSNLLESWATKDPNAAHAWWIQHGDIGFEGWACIISGIGNAHGRAAATEWAINHLTASNAPVDAMSEYAGSLFHSSPKQVFAIADGIADVTIADQFLAGLITGQFSLREEDGKLDEVMTRISTPEVRLRTLRTRAKKFVPMQCSDSRLQQWGITREQFDAASKQR